MPTEAHSLVMFDVDSLEKSPVDYELMKNYLHPDPHFVLSFLLDHDMIKATNPTTIDIEEHTKHTCNDGNNWVWSNYSISVPVLFGKVSIPSIVPVVMLVPQGRAVPTIFYQSKTIFGTKVTHRFECRALKAEGTSTHGMTQVKLSTWVDSPLLLLKKFVIGADHEAQIATLRTGSTLVQSYNQVKNTRGKENKESMLVLNRRNSTLVRQAFLAFVVAVLIPWFFTLENVSEMKFLMRRIPLSWVPFQLFSLFNDPDNTFSEIPCEKMSSKLLKTSSQPILFKSCFNLESNTARVVHRDTKEITVEHDFAIFNQTYQNLFLECNTPRVNNWKYESLNGTVINIIEKVPCEGTTLEEKIQLYSSHDVDKDGSYFDVHVFWLNAENSLQFNEHLHEKGFAPKSYSLVDSGVVSALGYYFSAGRTSVDYYHSHPERFITYGLQKTKVWSLIHPLYTDAFDYQWSGNAIVLQKEKHIVPRMEIHQDPGDVLFVPPWWIHSTSHYGYESVDGIIKSASLNVHFMTSRSLSGVCLYLAANIYGRSEWFFGDTFTRDKVNA